MKKSTKKKLVGGVAVATVGASAVTGGIIEAGALGVGLGAVAGAGVAAVGGLAVVAAGAAVYGLYKGAKWLFTK